MVFTERPADKLIRIATDFAHHAPAAECEAIVTVYFELDHRASHVIHRKAVVKQTKEGADRTARIVIFGLAEQERASTLEISQVHVVAKRSTSHLATTIDRQDDFWL